MHFGRLELTASVSATSQLYSASAVMWVTVPPEEVKILSLVISKSRVVPPKTSGAVLGYAKIRVNLSITLLQIVKSFFFDFFCHTTVLSTHKSSQVIDTGCRICLITALDCRSGDNNYDTFTVYRFINRLRIKEHFQTTRSVTRFLCYD